MTNNFKVVALYNTLAQDTTPTAAEMNKYYYFINNGTSTLEAQAAQMMADSGKDASYALMTNAQIVDELYLSLLGKGDGVDIEGKAYWVDQLTNNSSLINVLSVAAAIVNGVDEIDAANIENKYAIEAAALAAYSGENPVEPEVEGNTFRLTAGFDDKVGTDGNDTFKAPAYNNSNSFESGDELDGGAGSSDKLVATLGDSSSFAVRAETKSIEEVYFTSQAQNEAGDDGDNEVDAMNTVDAELMSGVREWWNDDSRADLTVEDVRSTSSTTTIGMRDTDAGTVDYSVYYDNQYITDAGSGAGDSTLVIKMVNAYTLAEDNNPIGGFTTVNFTVGTQPITVDVTGLTTYAEVIAAIQAELTAQGVTDVTVNAQADRTVQFSDDIGSYTQGQEAGSYTPILIVSANADLIKGTIEIGSDVEDYNGLNTMVKDEAPDVPSLTQTNVVLDNVGRDSKSGTLEIGAMSQSDYSGSNGIQQFNIDVERSSWLQEIRSTNDSLEVLDIRNIGITKGVHTTEKSDNGDLRVDYLKDVRVIDAAKMTGALTLTDVQLTDAVVEKYLELTDDASNPSADNSQTISYLDHDNGTFNKGFSYEFGSGNDTMNLTISGSNLEAAGTTTREDFNLVIDSGNGDDTITTSITNMTANGYLNSKDNANLEINTGAGNDTIWTKGAGDFIINAGSGADTVYADNSGAKAKWVVGAENTDIADLTTQTTTAFGTQFLVDGKLTVTLDDVFAPATTAVAYTSGYEVTVDIPTGANYAVTQLHINQAIKKAINGDAVLSKLLKAEDGQGDTLVITSLIDGQVVKDDLEITVASADISTYTVPQQNAITAAYQKFSGNSAAVFVAAETATETTAITAANNVNGIGATGAVLATSSSESVTIAGNATSDGVITTFIGGVAYGYTVANGDTAAAIADGMAAFLVTQGFTATSNGTNLVTITTADTVSWTSTATGATVTDNGVSTATLAGTNSTAESDNIITGGAGDDVIVLGTGANSNDTVVFSGDFGTDTVVNFVTAATDANAADKIDFTAYLTTQVSTSGSAESATNGAIAAETTLTNITGNDVVQTTFSVVDGVIAGTTYNFDTITDDQMLAVLNANGTFAVDTTTSHYGTTSKAVIMVENDANKGEYKVYDVTYTEPTGADDADNFTSAKLVGTIDFGETTTLATADLAQHA